MSDFPFALLLAGACVINSLLIISIVLVYGTRLPRLSQRIDTIHFKRIESPWGPESEYWDKDAVQ